MRAESERLGILCPELAHQLRPEHARGAHLGDFHEKIFPLRPEKRNARGKSIDRDARRHAGSDVFHPVGQGVADFQISRRSRLVHVITRHADAVEFRHLLGRVGKDVGHDAHRGLGRINVGVPHHVFLEDVVLDGAVELVRRNALLLGSHDVKCHDRNNRAVHRHGDGHLVQRDAIEECLHVEDGVDSHPGFAHIADHTRMIGVVAAVRGQIERHTQTHLTRGEVAAVECIALARGGEARVLADGPRADDIHRRIRSAEKRRDSCGEAKLRAIRAVGWSVGLLDRDMLHCLFGRRCTGHGGAGLRFGCIGQVAQCGCRIRPCSLADLFAQGFDEP